MHDTAHSMDTARLRASTAEMPGLAECDMQPRALRAAVQYMQAIGAIPVKARL